MNADQKAVADVYSSIPMQTRLAILDDLAAYARTEPDPQVRSGVMLAAIRIVHQATRVEREKRRKNG